MKTLSLLLLLALLSGCAEGPTYQEAANNEFTQVNHRAADRITASPLIPIDRNLPVLISTIVNIDALNQSSRFGRLVSEQIATRLTNQGFSVVEMKMRSNVLIKEETGELLLSRDVRALSKTHQAQVVVVGNYAVGSAFVYVTLKVINVADNRVISADNYALPLTRNIKALLAL